MVECAEACRECSRIPWFIAVPIVVAVWSAVALLGALVVDVVRDMWRWR